MFSYRSGQNVELVLQSSHDPLALVSAKLGPHGRCCAFRLSRSSLYRMHPCTGHGFIRLSQIIGSHSHARP